jgi:hypothetical protein
LISSKLTQKLELGISVLYSLLIMASAAPAFSDISNVPVVVYYLFVPGYNAVSLSGERYNPIFKMGYSIFLGLVFVLTVFSLRQIYTTTLLPFNIIIPTLTIFMAVYHYTRPATSEIETGRSEMK